MTSPTITSALLKLSELKMKQIEDLVKEIDGHMELMPGPPKSRIRRVSAEALEEKAALVR